MPTYISLLNFIDQGITTVKDTTQRSEGAAELAQEKYGCRACRPTGPWVPTTSPTSSKPPTTRTQPPSCWRWAPGESSGQPRFAPTITKRYWGSTEGSAEATTTRA